METQKFVADWERNEKGEILEPRKAFLRNATENDKEEHILHVYAGETVSKHKGKLYIGGIDYYNKDTRKS